MARHRIPLFLACGLAFCAPTAMCAQAPTPWTDVEQTIADPVEVRPIKQWTTDGAELESFRFKSHQWEGEWIWAYAIVGKPPGAGPFPGILHIHGGGQTASEANVLDWTRQGYAAMTFDWTGPGGRAQRGSDVTTPIPPKVESPRTDTPTIRHSKVWHAALIARRALTHLISRPEVDGNRIGSYGISWGGYTMWLVNGTDNRLKAACAIYGCGIVAAREASATHISEAWRSAYEPIHYASRQAAPILYLGATNDFFGWVPTYRAVAEQVTVEQRSAWVVNEDHHIAPAAATAYRWMDWQVCGGPAMPAEPTVQLMAADGRLMAWMSAPGATTVAVIFSTGEADSPQRLWHRRQAGKRERRWCVAVPVADSGESTWVMAEARYADGAFLNSRPQFVVPSELGSVAATLPTGRVLYDPDTDGDALTRSSGTELYAKRYRIRIEDGGPDGGTCVAVAAVDPEQRSCRAMLRHVSDPARAGRDGEALAVWVSRRETKQISIVATVKRRGIPYVARVPLQKDGPDWQRIVVKHEQLKRKSKDGEEETLPGWSPMLTLAVSSSGEPGFVLRLGRLEWVLD